MPVSPQFESIILMAAILLIPAVPAILVYKILPPEKVQIRGKILGLQVNAAGSFAGYILLVLLAFKIQEGTQKSLDEAAPYETWTISAVVKLDDAKDSIAGATVALVPRLEEVQRTSRSTANIRFTAPIPRRGPSPQITVMKDPYTPAYYPVGLAEQRDPFTNQPYRIHRDFDNKLMIIRDTLFLRPQNVYDPKVAYSPKIIPGSLPPGRK